MRRAICTLCSAARRPRKQLRDCVSKSSSPNLRDEERRSRRIASQRVFLKACRQPYGGLFSANRESELRTAMSEWGEWSPECAPKTNLIRLEYRFLKCLFRAEN